MARHIAQLVQSATVLNLNDGVGYHLQRDFTPPGVSVSPQYANAGSADKLSGAQLVALSYGNRDLTFTVNILGSSEKQVGERVRRLREIVSRTGDKRYPLFLEFKPMGNIAIQPVWGQDGWLRYEVEYGTVSLDPSYLTAVRPASDVLCIVTLVLRPNALGFEQQSLSATGGVYDDTLGEPHHIPRGTGIPEATTNLHTNPVFGHATYDNGWTTGANLIKRQITNKDLVLFGYSSVELTALDTTANTFTQSLTLAASAHVLSYAIAIPSRDEPTEDDLQITYNGTDRDTSFVAVPGSNGFYIAYASVTGTGGAAAAGITIKNSKTVVLCGAQAEAKAYRTPICFGDLMDCAWSGTAHASTSTRDAGAMFTDAPDLVSPAQGTIALMWRADGASDSFELLEVLGPGLALVYGGGRFAFADNTNTANGQAVTINDSDVFILHATYGPTGLKLYRAGVLDGSDPSFDYDNVGEGFYLGTNRFGASHANGVFMHLSIYDQVLTATEIAADAANLLPMAQAHQRASQIPWRWTRTGNDAVYNCNDASRDNYIVCGGIAGNVAALTDIVGTLSNDWSTIQSVLISRIDMQDWIAPDSFLYAEASGTADANASGGEYFQDTVDTSDTLMASRALSNLRTYSPLSGREAIVVARFYDTGSNALMKINHYAGSGSPIATTDYKSVTTAAAWRLLRSLPILFAPLDQLFLSSDVVFSSSAYWGPVFKRSTGSDTARCDYAMLLCRPFVELKSTAGEARFEMIGRRAVVLDDNGLIVQTLPLSRDTIELIPNRINMLISALAATGSIDPVITYTLTYDRISVTPRWSLL